MIKSVDTISALRGLQSKGLSLNLQPLCMQVIPTEVKELLHVNKGWQDLDLDLFSLFCFLTETSAAGFQIVGPNFANPHV